MNIGSTLITVGAFLASISFHEFCHAFVAFLLGDDTAKKAGRLTLNPLAHIDPLGLLMIFLVRIGWAKPVPIDPRNFRHPRLDSIIVGLAGPASNMLLALVCLYLMHHLPWNLMTTTLRTLLSDFLQISVWINVMLGLFNLIPLPPLDGSHFIQALLPKSLESAYYRFQPFSIIILIILLTIPPIKVAFFEAIVHTISWLNSLVL